MDTTRPDRQDREFSQEWADFLAEHPELYRPRRPKLTDEDAAIRDAISRTVDAWIDGLIDPPQGVRSV